MKLSYMGVDGCRKGWICVLLSGAEDWDIILVENAQQLAEHVRYATLTLIDIPIGLLESGGPYRECDQLARKLLGAPRASSVFPAPARQTVYARATGSYQEGCDINASILGRKISKQAWNICPKIREIDQLLREDTPLRQKLRECHPEVCFWSLNNRQAMQINKKKQEGREQRLAVLSRYLPADAILAEGKQRFRRHDVAADDIVDATVCALTARLANTCLHTLPEHPLLDNSGLAMEMVYTVP